ncbi:MAG: tetratricopeptide repeat protein, partial [Myxococcota bacterium]
ERLDGPDPDRLRRYLVPAESFPYQKFMVRIDNLQLDDVPIESFWADRIYPSHPNVGFRGRVHNRLTALDGRDVTFNRVRVDGVHIRHYGYDPSIYQERDKTKRSLPLIEATLEERPDDVLYRYYLGRELLFCGRVDEAVVVLERLAETLPAEAHELLPLIATSLFAAYDHQGATDRAIASAAAMRPRLEGNIDVLFGLSKAYMRAGRAGEGVEACRDALEAWKKPENQLRLAGSRVWEIHALMGDGLWSLGRYFEARPYYLRALDGYPEGHPTRVKILNNLAALSIEEGDRAKTDDLLEQLLSSGTSTVDMFFFEVRKRISRGEPQAARQLLEHGRGLRPDLQALTDYGELATQVGLSTLQA